MRKYRHLLLLIIITLSFSLAQTTIAVIDFDDWAKPNTEATNESGFFALPGGTRGYKNRFMNLATCAYFWTSTEGLKDGAWYWTMRCNDPGISREYSGGRGGFSVRCVKD